MPRDKKERKEGNNNIPLYRPLRDPNFEVAEPIEIEPGKKEKERKNENKEDDIRINV